LFVLAVIALCVGCAWLEWRSYTITGTAEHWKGMIAFGAASILFVVYGIWHVRKSRKLIV
jgi:hypothetical protein